MQIYKNLLVDLRGGRDVQNERNSRTRGYSYKMDIEFDVTIISSHDLEYDLGKNRFVISRLFSLILNVIKMCPWRPLHTYCAIVSFCLFISYFPFYFYGLTKIFIVTRHIIHGTLLERYPLFCISFNCGQTHKLTSW